MSRFVLPAVLLWAVCAEAQITRGSLTGVVTDPTGAAVPGVKLKITAASTGLERDSETNDAGVYRVVGLEAGAYRVEFTKDGFESYVVGSVSINTSAEVTLNPVLKVGATSTVIEITEPPVGVELAKSSATIERTFQSKFLNEIPLTATTRDINQVTLLAPTAARAPASTGISANGQRARNNNFMVDGVDNNDPSITVSNLRVIPEAVDQFQVQTSPYSAEFGRASGGQVSVITKSGSNDFHGNAWDYYRANWLESLNLLNKRAGLTETPRFNQNQAGGSLGGPVIRNRTFFFALIEANRTRQAPDASNSTSATIPTQAGYQALQSVALGDGQTAASRTAALNGLKFLEQIYALNPAFTPRAAQTVNGVSIPVGTINIPLAANSDLWYAVGRVDHRLTDSHQLSYRYMIDDRVQPNVTSNLQFGSLFAGAQTIRRQNHMASDTWTVNARTVNEFRFAYVKSGLDFPENDPVTPTTTLTGLFTIGGLSNYPQGRKQDQYQFQDTVTINAGRHSLRFGLNYSYLKLINQAAFNSKGVFGFDSLQDFVNNRPASLQVALDVASFDARQHQQAYFFQDDFKLRRNLTLNLGLRYETANMPFGAFGATTAEVLATGVPGPAKSDRNNWAPRFGFAYSPSADSGFLGKLLGQDRTVIRGGYGMTYDYLFFNILTVTASNYPRVRTAILDRPDLVNSWPSLQTGTAPGFSPTLGYVNAPENLQSPTAHIWSLSVQRQLGKNVVLELGYTGNRSYHGIRQGQLNPGMLSEAQAAAVRASNNANIIPSLQNRRLNPAWGSRTTIESTALGQYHAGYVRVDKRLSKGLLIGGNYTFSGNWSDNDESLGVADITASSPQIPQNFSDYRSEWSRSAFDRPHRLSVYWNYEVPWFTNTGLAHKVFGGWQVSGVYDTQSGQPFTLRTGVDTNGIGSTAPARANYNPGGIFTADPVSGDYRTFTMPINGTGIGTTYINPSTGLPLANSSATFGTLGRNTFRGPKWVNWNVSLFKTIPVYERIKIQLRWDMLNAFNQRQWRNPVSTMSSATFGANTGDPGNRSMILGAKIIF